MQPSVSSPLLKLNLQDTSEPVISQPKNFQRMSAPQVQSKRSSLTTIVITTIFILLALAGGGFVYYKYLAPTVPIDSATSEIIQSLFNANDSFATLPKDDKKISYE